MPRWNRVCKGADKCWKRVVIQEKPGRSTVHAVAPAKGHGDVYFRSRRIQKVDWAVCYVLSVGVWVFLEYIQWYIESSDVFFKGWCGVELKSGRGKSFVRYIQILLDKRATTLKSSELVLYPVCDRILIFSNRFRRWNIWKGLTKIGFWPVKCLSSGEGSSVDRMIVMSSLCTGFRFPRWSLFQTQLVWCRRVLYAKKEWLC